MLGRGFSREGVEGLGSEGDGLGWDESIGVWDVGGI